uniref:Uncharacterized protein n=1 Tax=Picea sitchensis TaxID=3332 RepID=B8LLB4_PICSI|nr:unknown [Picea sitchensis]
MDIGTGLASGVLTNVVTTAIISPILQQLKDVWELGKNLQLLNTEYDRMEESLRHIQNQFEVQQRQLPELVERCLGRIKDALVEANALIDRANRQRERCLGCCFFCSPKIPGEIREWKTGFGELFQHLQSALSTAANTAQIVGFAQPQAEVLLQPLPDSGFVGSGVETGREQLLQWLNEPHSLARVIGVYGMAGVGKTSLLQVIYNNCKEKVSTKFDFVIWYTVSQNYKIESLQDTIAEYLNLKFEPSSSIDTRKMKLYASLEKKSFLLILDDLWSSVVDLNQVGVNLGHANSSKVLISSRYKYVVETMAANEYCMMVQPLSTEEGWELFRRRAFRNGAVPDNNLETIAREVASECKGLPLAINTVAAALARKKTAEDWRRALVLMKNVDPSFPSTHPTIDAELYQRVRWSYHDLPNNLKMCFLYCAAFPEDAWIQVETLVEMWTAEGLVPRKGTTYFMDVGREYIDALVDRCLIEYVDAKNEYIKVHDILRDVAIYVGQEEENWLFLSGQHLQHFPSEEETRDRKRISVLGTEISDLPPDFECPTLHESTFNLPKRMLPYLLGIRKTKQDMEMGFF